jgi:hypothetical protein
MKTNNNCVGLDVLTAVPMKNSAFWDITLCSLLKINRRYGGMCHFGCCLLHAGFLVGLIFDPEDGGDIFLRNVC